MAFGGGFGGGGFGSGFGQQQQQQPAFGGGMGGNFGQQSGGSFGAGALGQPGNTAAFGQGNTFGSSASPFGSAGGGQSMGVANSGTRIGGLPEAYFQPVVIDKQHYHTITWLPEYRANKHISIDMIHWEFYRKQNNIPQGGPPGSLMQQIAQQFPQQQQAGTGMAGGTFGRSTGGMFGAGGGGLGGSTPFGGGGGGGGFGSAAGGGGGMGAFGSMGGGGFQQQQQQQQQPFGGGGFGASSAAFGGGGFGASSSGFGGGFGGGGAGGFGAASSATAFGGGGFGQQPQQSPFGGAGGGFGAGGFGQQQQQPNQFGQQPQQQQQQGAFGGGGFGQQPQQQQGAFGGGFGQQPQQQQGGFGQQQQSPFGGGGGFGATTSQQGFGGGFGGGGFGASSAAPFGGGGFGASQSGANPFGGGGLGGGFGASSSQQAGFGGAGGFGGGGFGAGAGAGGFGGGFGASSSSTGFGAGGGFGGGGLGQQSAGGFGAPAGGGFGAPAGGGFGAPAGGGFGAFGQSSSAAGFGGLGGQQSAGGFGGFGASSTPAFGGGFGQSSASAGFGGGFGQTPGGGFGASSGGFGGFGAKAAAPAFGAAGGFGQPSTGGGFGGGGGFGSFGQSSAPQANFGGFGAAPQNPAGVLPQPLLSQQNTPLAFDSALTNPYGVDFVKPVTLPGDADGKDKGIVSVDVIPSVVSQSPLKPRQRASSYSVRNSTLASALTPNAGLNISDNSPQLIWTLQGTNGDRVGWDGGRGNMSSATGTAASMGIVHPTRTGTTQTSVLLETPYVGAGGVPLTTPFRTPQSRPKFTRVSKALPGSNPPGISFDDDAIRQDTLVERQSTIPVDSFAAEITKEEKCIIQFSENSKYTCSPSIAELRSRTQEELTSVDDFCISIPGEMELKYLAPVDLSGLKFPIDEVIVMDSEDKTIDFYPDVIYAVKPKPGSGLNVIVEVSMYNMHPDIPQKDLEDTCTTFGHEFTSFRNGTWVFIVLTPATTINDARDQQRTSTASPPPVISGSPSK